MTFPTARRDKPIEVVLYRGSLGDNRDRCISARTKLQVVGSRPRPCRRRSGAHDESALYDALPR